MKTLIKTNNSLILVSDEEIKEGWKGLAYKKDVGGSTIIHKDGSQTHNPSRGGLFNHFYTTNTWYNDAKKILSQSPKLSKEVADEIGWIDVEELASQYVEEHLEIYSTALKTKVSTEVRERYKESIVIEKEKYIEIVKHYLKAQELNQKKYSEEDMINFVEWIVKLGKFDSHLKIWYNYHKSVIDIERYADTKMFLDKFQHLSQPQQWQVEAEEIDGVWNVTKINSK